MEETNQNFEEMKDLPNEVFLKKNFEIYNSNEINPDDILAMRMSSSNLRYELTGDNPIQKTTEATIPSEIYMHIYGWQSRFFLVPQDNDDIVYKLKNDK